VILESLLRYAIQRTQRVDEGDILAPLEQTSTGDPIMQITDWEGGIHSRSVDSCTAAEGGLRCANLPYGLSRGTLRQQAALAVSAPLKLNVGRKVGRRIIAISR
jgi:hypothetical protein